MSSLMTQTKPRLPFKVTSLDSSSAVLLLREIGQHFHYDGRTIFSNYVHRTRTQEKEMKGDHHYGTILYTAYIDFINPHICVYINIPFLHLLICILVGVH